MNFQKTFFILLATTLIGVWSIHKIRVHSDQNALPRPTIQTITDERIESIRNHPVNNDVTVTISSTNGSILLEGHEYNSVLVQVTKQGTKEYFKDVHAQITIDPNHVDINTLYERRDGHQHVAVQYKVSVPRTAHLESIHCTNGNIVMSNVWGPINAQTVNGHIVINESRDDVNATTANGTIQISPTMLLPGKKVQAKTLNGDITCIVPHEVNAHIRARTKTGKITADFSLATKLQQSTETTAQATLGSPNNQEIELTSTSGSIFLKRTSSQ